MSSELIKGYPFNSNITLLDNRYHYPQKRQDGKYDPDYMLMIFKDLETGKKSHRYIMKPDFDYYKLKPEYTTDHNLFIVEKEKVDKITCKYRDLLKSIAENTGNEEFFYENIRTGQFRNNQLLHELPNILFSDTNIEDRYRFMFDLYYKNDICPITKSFFDIEADTINMKGDFPEMGECPINAVSCIMEQENLVKVFLLRNPNNPLIEKFENEVATDPNLFKELREFLIATVGGSEKAKKYGVDNLDVHFAFFDEEIQLIYSLFQFINKYEPDFLLAWNMAFDIPYIYERIINLGYDPAEIMSHPAFEKKVAKYYIDERHRNEYAERCDRYTFSMYTVLLDQMIQFASRRKGQSAFKSFKLDDIGEVIAEVNKLDYSHITHDISKLPYLDYKTFVFYNIVDTIVQKCIEVKTGDIDYIFGKCIVNNTRYDKGHRQTVYLTNRGAKEFYNQGFIIGNNVNRNNSNVKFPGALVGNPKHNSNYSKLKQNGEVLNIMDNLVDFDYKSLYPSIAREHNMAPNTQVGRLEIPVQVYENENPFRYEFYYRGGRFLMDFNNGNYLEVGKRWFHLASIREMMEDFNEYFTKVKFPINPMLDINSDGLYNPIYHYPDIEEYSYNPIFHDYEDTFRPIIRDSDKTKDFKPYLKKIK